MVTKSNWICSCLCTLDENTILLFVKDETLALYYLETNPCFFKGEEFNDAKQDFKSSKTINENIGETNVGETLAGTLYWISCFFEQEQHVASLTCDTLVKKLHITNSQSIKVVRDHHNFATFAFLLRPSSCWLENLAAGILSLCLLVLIMGAVVIDTFKTCF